jgi:hypothetical protein
MYCIAVLIGLLTQSSIVSILVNFFMIFVFCPILSAREALIFTFAKNSGVQFFINLLYYVFPKPGEIKDITIALITGDKINFWNTVFNQEAGSFTPAWMSLITSLLFCAVVMAYSFYYFSKKDY